MRKKVFKIVKKIVQIEAGILRRVSIFRETVFFKAGTSKTIYFTCLDRHVVDVKNEKSLSGQDY